MTMTYSSLEEKKNDKGAEEMVQYLRALAVLPKVRSSIPGTTQ